MILRPFVGGPIDAQAYLIGDEAAGEAIVIDAPGNVAGDIIDTAERHGLRIIALVMTHGHFDHVFGLAELTERTGAPVFVHLADAGMVEHPSTAPFVLPFKLRPAKPGRLLAEGNEVVAGGLRFQVLHTPGHTPGSICLYEEASGLLFSGDTLFAGGFGRTDLPGGDSALLEASLARLGNLPPATRVYPGHGSDTTIGAEEWLASLEG